MASVFFLPSLIHTSTFSHFIWRFGITLHQILQLKCNELVSLSAQLVISTWVLFALSEWRRINLWNGILQLSFAYTYESHRQHQNMRAWWMMYRLRLDYWQKQIPYLLVYFMYFWWPVNTQYGNFKKSRVKMCLLKE